MMQCYNVTSVDSIRRHRLIMNNLKRACATAVALCHLLISVCSAQTHVHDEGQILLSQEGKELQLSFRIPAINAFGFEHAPHNEAELSIVRTFLQRVKANEGVVLGVNDCQLVRVEESFSHRLLEHHSKASSGHNHESHHGGEHLNHFDIEFTYKMECVNPPASLEVALFEHTYGLERVVAQWVTDTQQGAKTLTSVDTTVFFDPS